jgi:hypothetical protein
MVETEHSAEPGPADDLSRRAQRRPGGPPDHRASDLRSRLWTPCRLAKLSMWLMRAPAGRWVSLRRRSQPEMSGMA